MQDNNLLDDNLMAEQSDYENASTGQRFTNFLIDQVILYIFNVITITALLILIPKSGLIGPVKFLILRFLIGIFIFLTYYTLIERHSGKSVGKLITRTRAMTIDGKPLTLKKAFMRAICRSIPFEPLSFLGSPHGWHDTMTNTMVVKDRR